MYLYQKLIKLKGMNVKFVVDQSVVMHRKGQKYLWAVQHVNEMVSAAGSLYEKTL